MTYKITNAEKGEKNILNNLITLRAGCPSHTGDFFF